MQRLFPLQYSLTVPGTQLLFVSHSLQSESVSQYTWAVSQSQDGEGAGGFGGVGVGGGVGDSNLQTLFDLQFPTVVQIQDRG